MPSAPIPIWHGTVDEAAAFSLAILNNCECQVLRRRCPVHQAMLEQRWLDRMLWMRWMRERLKREEGLRCLDI